MQDTTRRQLLRSGLAAGAFVMLQGCSSPARRPGVRVSPQAGDPSIWEPKLHKPDWVDDGPQTASTGPMPGVISRSTWTKARVNMWGSDPMNGISKITVHHEGSDAFTSTSQSATARRLESIRRYHVDSQGWADIGYHYIVDPAGRVWEGRPVERQGAHVRDNNPHNLGVMVLGNFDQQSPTYAASKSLDDFVAAMMRKYSVPVSRVYTHQEIRPTACPGRSLQRVMESTRSRGGVLARA